MKLKEDSTTVDKWLSLLLEGQNMAYKLGI